MSTLKDFNRVGGDYFCVFLGLFVVRAGHIGVASTTALGEDGVWALILIQLTECRYNVDTPPRDFILGRSSAWSSKFELLAVSLLGLAISAVLLGFFDIASPNSIVELLYFLITYLSLFSISIFTTYFMSYQFDVGRK
ncbi:hypothetical protein [Haloferax sp. Atlit-48N]|uniref:Uncharacterized protein n=1 Tax=Haloferax sp. Atlit-48N TaxID=2077198 RepID=A0ACD5I494_9EURY|nr:hypothetical protein [Haloferax sp. Atlit-48N]